MDYHFSIPRTLETMYNKGYQHITTTSPQKVKQGGLEKEIFYLSNKSFDSNEWDSIKIHIKKSPYIHTLHFSSIYIDEKGLKSLGEIIMANPNIKCLKLEWNFLNNFVDAFEDFCNILANSNLQYIHLNNNKLSTSHINGFLRLLKCPSLVVLNLKWNEIGNDTVRSLIEHIKTNCRLQEINLGGNRVSQELLSELDENLLKNKKNKYTSLTNTGQTSFNSTGNNFYRSQHPNLIDDYSYNTISNFRQRSKSKEKKPGSEQYQILQNSQPSSYSPLYHYYPGNTIEQQSPSNNEAVDEEYRARYDNQLVSNINLEKRISELELELKTQKTKYIDLKDKYDNAVSHEKNQYDILQEEYNSLKDIYHKKEFELTQTINEYEGKISELTQQNEQLEIENSALNEKLATLEIVNEERIKDIKDSYKETLESQKKAQEDLEKENIRIRTELNDDLKQMTKNFEKNLKSNEDINRKLQREKDILSKETILLKKELSDFNHNKELEFKERETSIIEEEHRKIEAIIKDFEGKFLSLSNLFKEASSKNNYLSDELAKIRKESIDTTSKLEDKISQLLHEKENLNAELSVLNKNYSYSKSQVEIKDELVKRYKTELNSLNESMKKINNDFSNKYEEFKAEHSKDKSYLEQQVHDLKIENENLKERISVLNQKIDLSDKEKEKKRTSLIFELDKYIEKEYQEKYLK